MPAASRHGPCAVASGSTVWPGSREQRSGLAGSLGTGQPPRPCRTSRPRVLLWRTRAICDRLSCMPGAGKTHGRRGPAKPTVRHRLHEHGIADMTTQETTDAGITRELALGKFTDKMLADMRALIGTELRTESCLNNEYATRL